MEGCTTHANDDDDLAIDESRLDTSPTKAIADWPTYAGSASLLQGYTPLFEQATDGRCVAPLSDQRVLVGDVTSRLDAVMVSSREELAKQLGIDLDLKIKYGVGSINPTFKLIDHFESTGRSVFVLVTAAHTYKVANDGALDIKSEAAASAADPAAFLPVCGSHYIHGITYGARLLLGIRFDVSSTEDVDAIKAGLGLGVGIGPVGIDGSFGVKMKNTMRSSGASVALSVASQGYMMTKDGAQVDATAEAVKALLGETFDDRTINGLHGLVTSMASSVRADMCRDAPEREGCDPGPGFLANGSRHASVMRLDLRPYATLPSAPRGRPWLVMAEDLERVDDTLRALAPLTTRIEAAHTREIGAFLHAPEREQNRWGLASTRAVALDRDALLRKAEEWDGRFRPRVGNDLKPLQEMMEDCFSAAAAGVFDVCDPHAAKTGPAVTNAKAALRAYEAEGRVLPLVYSPVEPSTLASAKSKCTAKKMRLPSRQEVQQMAVAVRRASDLPNGGALPRTVWHAGPSSYCTAFYNPPEAGDRSSLDRCAEPAREAALLPAFCVPSDGPFAGR